MEALIGVHNQSDCAIILFVMAYMTSGLAELGENGQNVANGETHRRKRVALRLKGFLKRDSWRINEDGDGVYKLGHLQKNTA